MQGEMQVVVKGEVVMKGTMQGVMKGEGGHSHDDNYSHHGSANAGYWDTGVWHSGGEGSSRRRGRPDGTKACCQVF